MLLWIFVGVINLWDTLALFGIGVLTFIFPGFVLDMGVVMFVFLSFWCAECRVVDR